MSAPNPLVRGMWRGLAATQEATSGQLGYLLLQSAALLVWWPWSDMGALLEDGSRPTALLAVVIAIGASAALDGVRTGAEEVLLPGQHPLREWVVGTPLSTGRILRGWLAANLLQVLFALVLSAPLVLAAFAVAAATWASLAWALGAIVLLALCYRLCAVLLYLLLGHRPQATFTGLRVIVVVTYAAAALLLPGASHPLLAHALLSGGHAERLTLAGLAGQWVFVVTYGGAGGLMVVALYLVLRRERRLMGAVPSTTGSGTREERW